MATSFDRWEKDPFFSAAEEVQESADRMESTYRTWVHSTKEASSMWNSEELCRDLRTAVGTTKWQLEEFERAVKSSYVGKFNDDAKDRHCEFIIAIGEHISRIDNVLLESAASEGKASSSWMRLDEGECDELALFLSGSSVNGNHDGLKVNKWDIQNPQDSGNESASCCLKKSSNSAEPGSLDAREEKTHGHRRSASASADIGTWKITVPEEDHPLISSNVQAPQTPRKTPSFSLILTSMESASKFKWPKNSVRKWKARDSHQESDVAPLRTSGLTRGMDACYEKSKSCLESCDEYDKQLYGWCGAIQRQLQRSQYQMQYRRPVQLALSIVFFLFLIDWNEVLFLPDSHSKFKCAF